jgi:hypothetical protein
MLSAAAHESVRGTFETCRGGLAMSVDRGISEVPFRGRLDRFSPKRDIVARSDPALKNFRDKVPVDLHQ